ncbi:MAG: hypothetical protein K2X81_29200, partial [Candidatus Obscuribacterales bacterium]|nr:hypothetical protein [Candidatus Obscuribacterales bacterium]
MPHNILMAALGLAPLTIQHYSAYEVQISLTAERFEAHVLPTNQAVTFNDLSFSEYGAHSHV